MGLPPLSDSRTANSRERSWSMRAIRKRYFARSEPGSDDQPFANAARAAATASPTSSAVPSPTIASGSSLAGEIVSYLSVGSTHCPPMKWPYRSRSRTTSRDSGAGSYVQSGGTGDRPCVRSMSDTARLGAEPRSRLHPPTLLGGAHGRPESVASGCGLRHERQNLRARSVECEVVGALVDARPLLAELHQDVVQERRGAEAIE